LAGNLFFARQLADPLGVFGHYFSWSVAMSGANLIMCAFGANGNKGMDVFLKCFVNFYL